MSDSTGPLDVLPVRESPTRRGSGMRGAGCLILFVMLLLSLGLNLVLFLMFIPSFSDGNIQVEERFHSGSKLASDKIAIVNIDGVLMEGMIGFARRELERAATDHGVKAVILRVNSPGGTITASDDLHQRILELRDGSTEKKTTGKPVVVSMASVAASGGYYISVPAKTLLAEPTTITASIGVYAALPNVTELGNKVGFSMEVIKAGEVKDSGSPFHAMTPKERQLWQDMVDHSYLRFLQIVEAGRPQLKGKLQETITIDKTVPIRDANAAERKVNYTRYRADGGIFTADEALKYGLIDQIGYLDDAIKAAKQAAAISENYKVISYERPPSLFGNLLGVASDSPDSHFNLGRLSEGAIPRLWYMAPQSEFAGLLAAAGRKPEAQNP